MISTAGATPRAGSPKPAFPPRRSRGKSRAAPATCSPAPTPARRRRAQASPSRAASSTWRRRRSATATPSASACSTRCCSSCAPTATRSRTAPIPLLDRLERMAKEVRRDLHKMHAFVRFREVEEPGAGARFVAFFEPDHHIVRHTAGFFVRRFSNMRWSILTPELVDSLGWRNAQRRPRRDPCARRPAAIRSRRCGRPITPPPSTRRGSR